VKTRLAATVGAQRAADLYRAFLETVLVRFSRSTFSGSQSVAGSSPQSVASQSVGTQIEPVDQRCHTVLAYSPRERRDDFARLSSDQWALEPQADGDLGARMRAYFETALSAGYNSVLLIGSDAPTLPTARIVEAFAALERVPVVLGPADDGGYYLVGAHAHLPDIFDKIDWGTSEVWDQTVHRLQVLSTPFAELDPWYDVDDEEGLQRLQLELSGSQGDGALRQLRDRIWPPGS